MATHRALIGVLFVLTLCASFAVAQDRTARQALRMKLPELDFDSVALSEAIDFLRDVSGANIHTNWRALEEIGVGRDVGVTLDLRSVNLATALRLMLQQADPSNMLTYYVDDDIIEITTRELADTDMITKVYFVDDLLMVIPDFEGPDLNLEAAESSGSRSSGGGGGGGRGGQSLIDNEDEEEEITTKSERADDLIRLIQDIVQPNIWRDNGGTATIRYFNGHLIVTAPRSVHEAIGGPVN